MKLTLKSLLFAMKLTICLAASCPSFLSSQEINKASEGDSLSPNETFERLFSIRTPQIDEMLACPRCRRSQPPGPQRRPLPTEEEEPSLV